MGEVRDVYHEPPTKVLLRTPDVYQTEVDDGVEDYSEKLLSIVADYRNGGIPAGANAQSMVGKSKRGEVAVRLFARVEPSAAVIEAAGFKTRGCLAMTGCASAACDLIQGKSVYEALLVTKQDISDAVGGVPTGKGYTLTFAVEAIKALVADSLIREGMGFDELNTKVPCDQLSVECLSCEHCSLRTTRIDAFALSAGRE